MELKTDKNVKAGFWLLDLLNSDSEFTYDRLEVSHTMASKKNEMSIALAKKHTNNTGTA